MALKIEEDLLAVKQQLEKAALSDGQIAESGNVSVTFKTNDGDFYGRVILRMGSDHTVNVRIPAAVGDDHALKTFNEMRQTATQIIDSNLTTIQNVRQSITEHLTLPGHSHVASASR